jgi:hypothetical protein
MVKLPFPCCCLDQDCDALYARNFGLRLCMEAATHTPDLSLNQQQQNDAFVASINDEFSPRLFDFSGVSWWDAGSGRVHRQYLSPEITPVETTIYLIRSSDITVHEVELDWLKFILGAFHDDTENPDDTLQWYWHLFARLRTAGSTSFNDMTWVASWNADPWTQLGLSENRISSSTTQFDFTVGSPNNNCSAPDSRRVMSADNNTVDAPYVWDSSLASHFQCLAFWGSANSDVILASDDGPVTVPAC